MLYKFDGLDEKLDQLGYPDAAEPGFRVIKRDLSAEERAGNVSFKNDGVYLSVDAKDYKGYMYLKYKIRIDLYGLPKFHITNCSKVREERAANKFEGRYFWHNSNVVSIEDRPSGRILENQVLQICGYCKRESSIADFQDTVGFHSLLDKQEGNLVREVQLDIFGRPTDWDAISKEYRREKNYTCEKCGFGGAMLKTTRDREFIHTDHIVAWELSNMRRSNLQCLCILCHSQKDEVHRANFSKPGMRKRLKRFVDRYGAELRSVGNRYIVF